MKQRVKKPHLSMDEILVGDKRLSRHQFWLDKDYQVLLPLSDPHPETYDHEFDAVLRLMWFDEYVNFTTTMRYHNVGVLPTKQLRDFLSRCMMRGSHPMAAAMDVRAGMYDFEQTFDEKFPSLSGVEIVFSGERLEVRIGRHVFGSASGPLVAEFLRGARLRAGLESPTKKAA